MRTRALIICVSLLFAVSCSNKKTKINPSTTTTDEKTVVTPAAAESSDAQRALELETDPDGDTNSLEDHSVSIESINTLDSYEDLDVSNDRLTVPEIREDVMTEDERKTVQTAPAEAIKYSEEGIPYVDPYYESLWLEKYAKGGTARTMVLENREHISDELSEVLVIRTNATPEEVTVELKAGRMLKKMQMTFDTYVDYLSWEAGDCKEAFDSIYKFAERYNFQINRSYYSYSADCNCNKIKQEYTYEVLELFKYQRSSGWECPDNYITFKTCMDPTGDINKYETVKLRFDKANKLSEGDYEIYRVKIKQKKLGSKKLEFEVTPLASNGNMQLETEYDIKKGGLFKNRNTISVKEK